MVWCLGMVCWQGIVMDLIVIVLVSFHQTELCTGKEGE